MCDFWKKCSTSRDDCLSHVSFVWSFIRPGWCRILPWTVPSKNAQLAAPLERWWLKSTFAFMGWLNLAAANCQLQEVYGYAWEVGLKTTGCLLSTMALLPGPDIPRIARKQGFLPNGWVLHANFPPFSAKLWIIRNILASIRTPFLAYCLNNSSVSKVQAYMPGWAAVGAYQNQVWPEDLDFCLGHVFQV